jgi:2,3-dihydroxybenzoate-AMP ligase
MHELLRAQKVASFKRPERREAVSPFPLSPAGEILKRQLREMIAARMEDERAGARA